MPFIEVKSGAPEIPADWEDGTYPLLLVEIGDPKRVLAQKGQMAGHEVDLIDWTFVIDDQASHFDQLEVRRSTSTASGPKSAMYGILTALLGGRPPAIGQKFEKSELIGRRVLGALAREESGYLRVNTLTALPTSMLQQRFAETTGAPVQAPAGTPARDTLNMQPTAQQAPPERRGPARAAVAVAEGSGDDLPF